MWLYLFGLGAAALAALLGATLPQHLRVKAAALGSSVACLATFLAAGNVLLTGHAWAVHSAQILPFTGVNLALDPLGALFVTTTAVVGLAASCYSIGYSAHDRPSRTISGTLPLFLATLLLVPAAASVATFMVAWELMALTSLLLVAAEHRHRAETRSAALWYGAMTHVGAAGILLGLVVLAAHDGGQTFAAMTAHRHQISATVRSVVFLLVLLGFASKAGAVPLHVWLPRAHPEAPSPVSALMLGAMVNLGIYGIIRVGLDLLGGGLLWWWWLVMALGIASALFGAVHVATSTDLKRLLAYSTVDNMGLVLIGVGAAGALARSGYELLGALAMLSALFHLVNHSLFKGCLFLGAGAVQHATGTRDLDQLGGLARHLPVTATLFGIGALSISAIPPFNGFASEWLLFEALFHGFAAHGGGTQVALLAGVAALALTGGLTAAAFVKAVGIGFLGQARTAGAKLAREVAPTMLGAMALLAAGCLVIGVAPGIFVNLLRRATTVGLSVHTSDPLRSAPGISGLGVDLANLNGAIEPVLVLFGLLGAVVLTWGALRLLARRSGQGTVSGAEAWGCGRELQTARMEYTATSFAEPLQRVFADVLRPDHDIEVTHATESRYFAQAIAYQTRIDDGIERSLYRPPIRAVEAWGRLARRVPNGSVNRYVAFGFVALVVLLVVLA